MLTSYCATNFSELIIDPLGVRGGDSTREGAYDGPAGAP